jgi:zinc protease
MARRAVSSKAVAVVSGVWLVAVAALWPPLIAQSAPPAAGAVALPAGVARVTSVEGITEYRWPNGFRALIFPDESKQTITVNITYLVGSRHENYGESGMAHLLEHLVFKGTPRHPNIPQELTEHGARPNGTTWVDRTNYFETFQASDANLEWALDLEADRMINSFIAKKDLDSEMTVVRNEFEAGENNPFRILFERAMSTAYLWHNYGKSTIGARSDLENVPIDRLQAFYRTYYQPDNAILLVAGKVDEAKALGLVDKYFRAIPRPARALQPTYTSEPTQDGERTVTLRRVGDVQIAGVLYHVPPGSHPDYASIEILSHVLGSTPSGRLHKALVETKKAATVEAFGLQFRDPGPLWFDATVRQDSPLEPAREALLQTIEGIGAAPVTPEEVDRARTELLRDIELDLNSSERIGLQISEWAAMGDWRLLFLHRDRLKAVSAADVQRVALAYLKPANRTVALFLPTPQPDRAEIPPLPDVAAMLKDYKGGAAVAAGEVFDPAPANIERRTTRPDAGAVRLALVPKRTRGGAVMATLTARFGTEENKRGRRVAASLAGAMLMRGTTKHTRQQLTDEFAKLKATVNVSGGNQVSATIETTRENLVPALRLVAEVLREASFPESEFELLRQERLALIELQRSNPQAIASLELTRHLRPRRPDDIRYVPTFDEQVAETRAATLDDARRFYREFYGASNSELAVVGDFDAAEIQKVVAELFGAWKSPQPFDRLREIFEDVPAVNRSVDTPDKPNAVYYAGLRLNLRDDDPDYPAVVLGNYMLGGGFLNSRLATRVRQKEGLSYGVGSSVQANALDRDGQFVISAIYAPQNVAKLEAAVKDELDRMLKDGFTAEEVAAAKSGYLQGQQVARAQDATLANRLANYRYLNRTMAWDSGLEERIGALTPAMILDAMRRHVDPAKLVVFKAGDF